jgi:hypothetical protein
MGGNVLSAWRLPRHKGRTNHRTLMRYGKKRTWRVSLCICRSHARILCY